MGIQLFHNDCFNVFPLLEDKSIDLVLCDMPYGTTACKWDTIIDLERMWKELQRITSPTACIGLFSQMPFSAALVVSNLKQYRYELVWHKVAPTGFLNAKKMPLRSHENIQIFYCRLPVYNPQMTGGHSKSNRTSELTEISSPVYRGGFKSGGYKNYTGERCPTSVYKCGNSSNSQKVHPTQKPAALMEYLIKTYSNEGDTVLDFCMGSGTTGVACKNLNRNFIGVEKEENYFNIAKERIQNA